MIWSVEQKLAELQAMKRKREALARIAELARDFIHEGENWEAFMDSKGPNSASWPPEFILLAEAVEAHFGAPVRAEDE
jgi:hypothetical protein